MPTTPPLVEEIRKILGLPDWTPFWDSVKFQRGPASFTDPIEMAEFNIYHELKAIQSYMIHSAQARTSGNEELAKLFDHIRAEEEEHAKELASYVAGLRSIHP